jgi:hypothetical protein
MTTGIFDARSAQGAINNAQANEINQNYGEQTTVDTDGGDAAGRDIDKSVNTYFVVFSGKEPDSEREERELHLNYVKKLVEDKRITDRIFSQALRNSLELDWSVASKDSTKNIKNLEKLGSKQLQNLITCLEQLEAINCSESQDGSTPLASSASKELNIVQSYLLIVLRPETDTDKYRINAWLIPDETALDRNDSYQGFESLDIDDMQTGVTCCFDEVPKKVNAFLQECLDRLLDYNKDYHLTIELFLPDKYLCTDINCWQFQDDNERLTPLTKHYTVLLRSSRRLERKYQRLHRSNWRKNWNKVEQDWQLPASKGFHLLKQMKDFDRGTLAALLRAEQKIGIQAACALPLEEDQKELLFGAIHDAATPIAVWFICDDDIPNLEDNVPIFKELTNTPLGKLPDYIKKQRLFAHAKKPPEQHLGYHLSILWENPYRLPPLK